MNRRSSLKYLAVGGLVTSVGGGSFWLSREREHVGLALDLMVGKLQALDLEKIDTTGAWGAARTFNHLAQSVEFSIKGYPEMKSPLFQSTVGKLAFSVFQANGRMTHGLDEEIPGETVVIEGASPARARERLIRALEEFDSFTDALQPHFAYGALSKSQYALAHAMHVNNHLEEFRVA